MFHSGGIEIKNVRSGDLVELISRAKVHFDRSIGFSFMGVENPYSHIGKQSRPSHTIALPCMLVIIHNGMETLLAIIVMTIINHHPSGNKPRVS